MNAVTALPEMPEGQLEFFDPSVYKESLFSLAGANKHSTDLELAPGQQVSGRFTGTVIGLSLEGFASMTATPTRVFKITADEVVLD
jgi:hypothetical protein